MAKPEEYLIFFRFQKETFFFFFFFYLGKHILQEIQSLQEWFIFR